MPTKLNHQNGVIRVCVDHVDKNRVSGRVYSRRLATPMAFSDLGSLLLQLEELLESQNFPQSFQRIRSFTPRAQEHPNSVLPIDAMEEETVSAATGALATLSLNVISRQNATWQGNLDLLDGSPPISFSSDLELIKLMEAHVAAL